MSDDLTLMDANVIDDEERRPTRNRGKSHLALLAEENRKAAEENDEFDSDEEESSGEEPNNNTRRAKPTVRNRWQWRTKDFNDDTQNSFQSVDGDKIFCTWSDGSRHLDWDAAGTLSKGMKSLVAKQDVEHSVTIDSKPT